jgi:hypothetical protein
MLSARIVVLLALCLAAVSSDTGRVIFEANWNWNVSSNDQSSRKLSVDQDKPKCLIIAYDKIKGHVNWMQVTKSKYKFLISSSW